MHNNSEKKLRRNLDMQRHISEGVPTSEADETSRDDDNGVGGVPADIVEEMLSPAGEIEMTEKKQSKTHLASVEEPLSETLLEKLDQTAELVKMI